MEKTPQLTESLEDFKNSFYYGTRTNMNFKFLKGLSASDAGDFFEGLSKLVGEAMDTGDLPSVLEYLYQWQTRGYQNPKEFFYDDGPFTKLTKPISKLKVGLISSSGHFLKDEDPKPFGIENMSQEDAISHISDFIKEAPEFSKIPMDTPPSDMSVRHGGYDINGAKRDPNTVFPIELLTSFQKEKKIGSLPPHAFSFVGACSQKRLLSKEGPALVDHLEKQQLDAILLVPV